jgi:hypothetical protein
MALEKVVFSTTSVGADLSTIFASHPNSENVDLLVLTFGNTPAKV